MANFPSPNMQAVSGAIPVYIASGATQLGLGGIQAVPAGTTNGTPLGTQPPGSTGAKFYLPASASVTYALESAQPTSAPTPTFTITNSTTGYAWTEAFSTPENIYVTATAGAPLFRWV